MSLHHMRKPTQGFTLLELLVVVAIIGFLSSVSILALSASQQNNRDKQRKLDQLTIIKGAELFINDFGAPPTQFCVTDENGVCQNLSSAETLQPVAVAAPNRSLLNGFFMIDSAYAQRQQKPNDGGGTGGGGAPGGGGSGAPVCGNGVTEGTEQCDDGDLINTDDCTTACKNAVCGDSYIWTDVEQCDDNNTASGDGCSATCQTEVQGGGSCNGNAICEPAPPLSENIVNCPSDCSTGGGAGGQVSCDNDTRCEVGETPGNCPADCRNISMCYVAGQWNLCCAFGTNCTPASGGPQGSLSGYYGVCNADRCEQRYLLQAPPFTCANDGECVPGKAADPVNDPKAQNKYVNNTAPNWMKGLEPYVARIPVDPGHHNFGPSLNAQFDKYYASSHPDIVGKHKFCVWVSLERQSDNFNPYNDLIHYPTDPVGQVGAHSIYWTPLCAQ